MAKPAIKALDDGDLKFVPSCFDKIYLHWLENIRDWCISDSYGGDTESRLIIVMTVVKQLLQKKCRKNALKCGCTHLHQDEDTLDTWFSSALWPFSTLGWPEKTPELEYFYPTDVLGYRI